MNLLNSFLILLVAFFAGFLGCVLLKCNSFIKIALVVVGVYVVLEVLLKAYEKFEIQITPSATVANTTNSVDYKVHEMPTYSANNWSIIKEPDRGTSITDLPFDNLPPKELMTRLNYLYEATSNPYKHVTYADYKTAEDKKPDNEFLVTDDPKLLGYARAYYPQLTALQTDAKDCLNEGSTDKSCYQSPALFANLKKSQEQILDKGVNRENAEMIIKEDFSDPMILNPENRFMRPLFKNAPMVQDIVLDSASNEYILLQKPEAALCRHCKMAVCKDDYCGLQNNLFM